MKIQAFVTPYTGIVTDAIRGQLYTYLPCGCVSPEVSKLVSKPGVDLV